MLVAGVYLSTEVADGRTIPRPPALLTAAANSAYPTHCIPPWTMGTGCVSIWVVRVCDRRTGDAQFSCQQGVKRHVCNARVSRSITSSLVCKTVERE